ncbi:zinc finger protein 862-like [Saccoglossus kowalevskii]|uniref:Zinc finger protein 862-like n=1 Tax=Saccoglossus kowalevskii TaxID=10224 RepID=A0ABM0LW34_SACKO|nr:PREDICTED: zinc finger protein 862-like [Saccoglossus kowalevskii]
MLNLISEQLEESTLSQMKKSDFFTIMLDETKDVSVSEQLTLNCRFIDDTGNLCVRSLKLIEPLKSNNGEVATVSLNAENITGHITSYFKDNELEFSKLCGIGTDGAAVMTWKHNGVVKHLQGFAPSAIGIHCCGHRLQLASTQSANVIPYVKKFNSILRQL